MLELPWYPRELGGNHRGHWTKRERPRTSYKLDCYMLTKGYLANRREWRPSPDCPLPVKVTFYPPDRRHRDDDNMIHGFKHGRDSMADALGINDRMLRPEYHFAEPVKGGLITVEMG